MGDSIGNERLLAEESLRKLAERGAEVKHLTTDADSTLYQAAEYLHGTGVTSTTPIHQLDTRHLGKSQRSKVKATGFSDDVFSGRTAEDRKTQQARFADDLASRCQAEHSAAYRQSGRHRDVLKRNMTFVTDAILLCYQGDHSLCRIHSFVCKGTRGDNWIKNSCFLADNFSLTCNSPDTENKIRDCVNFRIGQAMLKKTRHLFNTQKAEAVNRSISKSVPKNKTFSRNFLGRTRSAINSVNLGIANSIVEQCKYVSVPVPKGSKAVVGLYKRQKRETLARLAKKTTKSKARRVARKYKAYKLHYLLNVEGGKHYKKDLLKPVLEKRPNPKHLCDHSYYNLRYRVKAK